MGEGSRSTSASARASVTFGQRSCEPWSRSELLSSLRSDWRQVQRTVDLIVLHCSDTRPSQTYTIEQLQRDHATRGFGAYPGYHFFVARDGSLYYCRPLSLAGCHVKGYNAHSIGVCYEGGHRDDEMEGRKYEDNRTAEQMITLHFLLSTLHEMFPKARICGHHDLNPAKACPCFDAEKEYGVCNI